MPHATYTYFHMPRHDYHKQYLHHQKQVDTSLIREAVFGMEDGMVSTFGAITGIATATQDPFTVTLSGLVIISVESISMAVGSYLSSKSEQSIDKRKLKEERMEIHQYPEEEKEELIGMYVADGWPKVLATEMAETAAKNKELFLKEMAYRELKVFPDVEESPKKNALVMGVAYIIGGSIPLLPYLLLTIGVALPVSIVVTLAGLFFLGVATTRYSHRSWWKAGLEMLTLASLAGAVGYGVGQVVDLYWLK